jgi:hypothetical protein
VSVLTVMMLALGGIAAAANEPLLELTFPQDNGAARSVIADVIFARYDRPLSEAHSSFKLRDAADNPVSGTTFLSEPPGPVEGLRQINFRPDAPLSEAASPYIARARVSARLAAGETTTVWTFSIDDTAPAAPVVTDPSDGDIRTDQPLIARGTGEPGATAFVIEDATVIAESLVNSLGVMEVFLPYPPEDGVSHTFEVLQRDPAGNVSPSAGPITVWHDSVVRAPVILTPAEGAFLNIGTVAVTGTAKAGTLIRIREGGPIIGTATTSADESWSVSIAFADGVHAITAESWDGVFTDGPSPARTFTIDTVAPAAPVITAPTPGQTLAAGDVRIEGTAELNAKVQIRHQGIVRAIVPVDAAGAWGTTLTFVEGSHTIEARAIDRADNIGPIALRSFTVDTVAPATPIIDTPAQSAFLNSNNVSITGETEPGADLEIFVGTVVVGATSANGVGAFAVTLPFADGAHTIHAVALDAAGNRSPPTPDRSFTVDTVAPDAPVIQQPAQNATLTSNPVTISGTGEDAVTIEVWDGATLLGETDTDGTGTWALELTLADGTYSVRARAIDLALNVGPFSAPRDFEVAAVVDNAPPAVPVLTLPAALSTQSATVVFKGTAEPGATVTIYEAGIPVASGTSSGGTFEFAGTMTDGPHTVTATATDPAGNESPHTAARSFTVDGVRPTVSITTQDGSIFTVLTAPRIDGTADDDRVVTAIEIEYRSLSGDLVAHLATCIGCPGAPVAWEDEPTLPTGSYTVTVTAVDGAGNRSHPAQRRIYVI